MLYDAEAEEDARRIYKEMVEQEILWAAETYGRTFTLDDFPPFHCWYADWQPVRETTLAPRLDTVMREVCFKAENPLIRLVGKLELVHDRIFREGRDYYTVSETGVMRFGDHEDAVTLVLVPGEIFPELEAGGAMLTAEDSCSKTDFGFPPIREMFGERTVVFGLANDAIGYILPDNDYAMMLDFNAHYHELLSLGKGTASALFAALQSLA